MIGDVATAPRPAANRTPMTPIAGIATPRRRSGVDTQTMPIVASRTRWNPASPVGSPRAADHRARSERGEQEPRGLRARAVVPVREHGQRDEDRLREHVQEDDRQHHRAKQRVAEDEAKAGEDALVAFRDR